MAVIMYKKEGKEVTSAKVPAEEAQSYLHLGWAFRKTDLKKAAKKCRKTKK